MLTIEGVHTFYGNIEALRGVDVEVREGEIVTLIGANGAGKSTLLMTICGQPRATRGRIAFEGQDITRWPTHAIIRAGIAQSPEGRRIFARMSVYENLLMGATVADKSHVADDLCRVYALFPILQERADQRGGTLSGGEQQMLTMCRSLLGNPQVILIDEPTEGLAPKIVQVVGEAIRDIHSKGVSVVLVEQKLAIALKVSSRVCVMGHGRIVFEGTPEALTSNPQLMKDWLAV